MSLRKYVRSFAKVSFFFFLFTESGGAGAVLERYDLLCVYVRFLQNTTNSPFPRKTTPSQIQRARKILHVSEHCEPLSNINGTATTGKKHFIYPI